jgi:hypothetical protein
LTDQNAGEAKGSPLQESLIQPWQFFLLAGMLAATATVIVATGQAPANIIVLSVTVVSVSFVGMGAYRLLAPLVSTQPDQPMTIGGRTRIAIEREKALVLRSLKELEFDYAMGKMAKVDFDEMSARLRARALGLMRQIDAGGGYREQIAREVQQRLDGRVEARSEGHLEGRLEGDGFSHRQDDAVPGRCECGTQNDPDAKFCKNCGAKL